MHISDKVAQVQKQTELRIASHDAEVLRNITYQSSPIAHVEPILLGELDVINDYLELVIKPSFAKIHKGQAANEYLSLVKMLIKRVKTGEVSLEEAVDAGNELMLSVWSSATYKEAAQFEQQNKAAKEEKTKEALSTFDAYCDFTYMLEADGKLMVLTDELQKSEHMKSPNYHGLFTISAPRDAKLKAANYPFYKEIRGKSEQANVYDEWIISPKRKTLAGLTFNPRTTDKIVDGKFNVWQGWKDWGPSKPGADKPFWDLVMNRICGKNEEYFEFVQKWLAHMVQRPWERPLCALGIQSGQGTGKTSFVKIIGGLMNERHYNPDVKMPLLLGKEMGKALEGVLLAYVDEATFGGDIASAGHIKKAITGETDYINEKFVPAYSIPTYKRIVFSSNEGYYYHADPDDRRLLPLEVPASLGPLPYEEAQQLFNGQEYRPELMATVLETLKNIDISAFVPYRALCDLPINTGAELIERSMTSVQRWLKESIDNNAFEYMVNDQLVIIDGDVISVNELYMSYAFFCSQSALDKNRMMNIKSHNIRKEIVDIFGNEPAQIKRNSLNQRRYTIDWNLMRSNFEGIFKWKIQWINEAKVLKFPNFLKGVK